MVQKLNNYAFLTLAVSGLRPYVGIGVGIGYHAVRNTRPKGPKPKLKLKPKPKPKYSLLTPSINCLTEVVKVRITARLRCAKAVQTGPVTGKVIQTETHLECGINIGPALSVK